MSAIAESNNFQVFWTPCVILFIALMNICAAKNTKANKQLIKTIIGLPKSREDAHLIKVFILDHAMRLAMFNEAHEYMHRSLSC